MSVAIAAGVFVSCNIIDDQDYEAIKALVLSDDVWFDAGSPNDSTVNQPSSAPLTMATADSLWWWVRNMGTPDTPDVFVDIVGDSGHVEWVRNNNGTLISFPYLHDTVNVAYIDTWMKEFSEEASIRAIFRRTGTRRDDNHGWELEKVSCAAGNSNETNTITIDSVNVRAVDGDPDVTIVDPLNTYFDVDELTAFNSAESVTVTLYTNNENTVAFLHTIVAIWPTRTPFENMGGGVHQGTWTVQLLQNVPRFAIFDVMHESSLWDDEYGYDYAGVLFPYTISNQ